MTKKVLIVDNDPGFSTILAETLNNHPAFTAVAVRNGTQAMEQVVENPLDLVIVDMALSDVSPSKLIAAIREHSVGLAIMVIPLMGGSVPDTIQAMTIQGVLTKPFFVGDLPQLVGAAVGLDLAAEAPPPPSESIEPAAPVRHRPRLAPRTPSSRRPSQQPSGLKPKNYQPPTSRRSRRETAVAPADSPLLRLEQLHKHAAEIVDRLRLLNSEVRADAIFLTMDGELIAQTGSMSDDRTRTLASLVATAAEAAAQAAAFLGERDGRFEQSLHEGGQYRLYSFSLGHGAVLSLALGTNLPLGMVRHQTKLAGQDLIKFIK